MTLPFGESALYLCGVHDYRKLEVWQRSRLLMQRVHNETDAFPSEQRYVFVAQMRRSALSICSNIAEGSGRGTNPDFARFVSLAAGSAAELECQILLAGDLALLDGKSLSVLQTDVTAVKSMLKALHRRLETDGGPTSRPIQPDSSSEGRDL